MPGEALEANGEHASISTSTNRCKSQISYSGYASANNCCLRAAANKSPFDRTALNVLSSASSGRRDERVNSHRSIPALGLLEIIEPSLSGLLRPVRIEPV